MVDTRRARSVTVAEDDRIAAATILFSHRGRQYVTAIGKVTARIVEDGPCALDVPEPVVFRPEYADPSSHDSSLVVAPEIAPRLLAADVTLNGTGYQPDGRAAPSRVVGFGLHRDGRPLLHKQLYVYGDRRGGTPQPFWRMPLQWQRAFGGPGHELNPVGCGMLVGGAEPNILDPRNPRHPAGFGPISPYWGARARLLAGQSPISVEGVDVSLPDDVAFAFYQAAPFDQRIRYLTGDEWMVFDGLHPHLERYQARLTGLRVSARLMHQKLGSEPISMVLDTLTIDTDAMRVNAVFRGQAAIVDDAQNYVAVFALDSSKAVVPLAERKPSKATVNMDALAQERAAARRHVPYKEGARAERAATPAPAKPPPWAEPQRPAVKASTGLEQTISVVDFPKPDALADTLPGTEDRPTMLLPETPPENAVAPPAVVQPPALVNEDSIGVDSARTPRPPASMRKPPAAAPPPVRLSEPPEEPAPVVAVEEATPVPSRRHAETGIRKTVLDRVAARQPCEDLDLDGADLSGLDLTEARLSNARLDRALLAGTKLDRADLRWAKLSRADLRGASLNGADLSNAKLNNATLSGADLQGARLVAADLQLIIATGARFAAIKAERAVFAQARCDNANFDQGTLIEADFTNAIADGASFVDARLESAKLGGVRADGASLRSATLDGVHATGASLKGCDAEGIRGERSTWDSADFTGSKLSFAKLGGSTFVRATMDDVDATSASFAGSVLTNASLLRAKLVKATLVKAELRQVKLSDAVVTDADLGEVNAQKLFATGADLRGTSFKGASLRSAKLDRVDLRGAVIDGCDLRDASLQEANLTGVARDKARLGGANLKGAVGE